ncbi:MAG: MgtC/SapB family protein [Clostridiales bacterium]|nr:MgtC/SapB family protein [Clostridiales bacterium]
MAALWDYLKEFNFWSVLFRLVLAMASGGIIGYGREKKERNAGLRTYMLISIGAALTVLISECEYELLCSRWAYVAELCELKFDGTRYAAGVLAGIGFLAAGTIIASAHQQVSGLTSAIGLFAAAVLGIASGAAFYECVIPAIVVVVFCMEVLQPFEILFKRRLRNITITVKFNKEDDIRVIRKTIERQGATIFDIDIEEDESGEDHMSAIFSMKMSKEKSSHSEMLSSIAELPCVRSLHELIS